MYIWASPLGSPLSSSSHLGGVLSFVYWIKFWAVTELLKKKEDIHTVQFDPHTIFLKPCSPSSAKPPIGGESTCTLHPSFLCCISSPFWWFPEQPVVYEPSQILCVVLTNVGPSEAASFSNYYLELTRKNWLEANPSRLIYQEYWLYAVWFNRCAWWTSVSPIGDLATKSPIGKNRAYNPISSKDTFGAKMTFSTNTCKYCFDIVIFLVVDKINPLSSDWLLSSGKSMNKILLHIICSGSQKSIARSRKDFLNTILQQDCSSTFLGRPNREWEKDGGLNCGNASIWEPAEENKARGKKRRNRE